MITKLILLTVVAFAVAKKTKILKIQEGGENFDEKIILDEVENTEEIQTPKHCNREGVHKKIFYNLGFVAERLLKSRLCIIRKKGEEDGNSVKDDERSIRKAKGKFPYHKVKIIEDRNLPVPYDNIDELPSEVRRFCRGLPIVKALVTDYDFKKIGKIAVEYAKDAKRNARKRAVVKEFIACTNASTMKIMTCPADKLCAQCKIRRPSCTYKISCPMQAAMGGFNCEGEHRLNSIVCCDYNC